MQANEDEANADNAFVPPPEPFQSSPALCFNRLLERRPIVYYDYEALHELYGTAPIQMWKDMPQCKVLLLRLGKDRWEQQQPDLGNPVLTCAMPRFYLPRNQDRSAHLCAYVKPWAVELANKLSDEIEGGMLFKDLVTEVLSAVNTDALLIAHPAEVNSLHNFDPRDTRLCFV